MDGPPGQARRRSHVSYDQVRVGRRQARRGDDQARVDDPRGRDAGVRGGRAQSRVPVRRAGGRQPHGGCVEINQ